MLKLSCLWRCIFTTINFENLSTLEKFTLAFVETSKNQPNSAFVLKSLCDDLGIFCLIQPCSLFDAENNFTQHFANLIYIKDEKYDVDGIFYSDSSICSIFDNNIPISIFNTFLVSPKVIDSINLKTDSNSYRISTTDYAGIYYSNNLKNADILSISNLIQRPAEDVIILKNKIVDTSKILELLFNNLIKYLNFDIDYELQLLSSSHLQIFATTSSADIDRSKLVTAAKRLVGTEILKDKTHNTFDCASFLTFLFMSELGVDICDGGFGSSLTGQIMTSKLGTLATIRENLPLEQKVKFINNHAQVGDIMLFHRQSKNDCHTTPNNWYPGHVGIYIGDGQYIDARHNRGNISVVNIFDDNYMQYFIGIKDIITPTKSYELGGIKMFYH